MCKNLFISGEVETVTGEGDNKIIIRAFGSIDIINFIVFIGFYCFTYALQNSQKHFSSVFGLLYLQIFWSFIIILSKYVSKDDSPITMVSYQYTLMTIFALPLAIYFWQMPSINSIIYVFCIKTIFGTVGV